MKLHDAVFILCIASSLIWWNKYSLQEKGDPGIKPVAPLAFRPRKSERPTGAAQIINTVLGGKKQTLIRESVYLGPIMPWKAPGHHGVPPPKFWVVVPASNAEKWIANAINSVTSQVVCAKEWGLGCEESIGYPHVHIVVGDDGSVDDTVKVARRAWKLQPPTSSVQFDVVSSEARLGPAYTKRALFEWVERYGDSSDVVVVLDGDDMLYGPLALAMIASEYSQRKCWFTYGSMEGKWAEQIQPFEWTESSEVRDSKWVYGHPRTFKQHLLSYMKDEDFQGTDGEWLNKGTERGFVYKMLELSGASRTCYIDRLLYTYVETPLNTYKLVSESEKKASVAIMAALPRQTKVVEPIHIVVCSWKRIKQLGVILFALHAQEGVGGHLIHVHVWNNNWEHKEELESTVGRVVAGADPGVLKIDIFHSPTNVYGWGRFLMTKELLKTTAIDHVLFIDDDFFPHATLVYDLWSARAPMVYAGWYGRVFLPRGSYWETTIGMNELIKGRNAKTRETEFDYVGTGGCVVDTSIFLYQPLWECPEEYRMIEDMWLSFIAKAHLGYKTTRVITGPTIELKSNKSVSVSQWDALIKKKNRWLWMLRAHGWRV